MRSCVRSIASVACASSRPFQIVSQRTAPISRSIAVAWAMSQAKGESSASGSMPA